MKLFLGSIVFISVACLGPLALADTIAWTNTGDSNWDNANNWTSATATGTIPSSTDNAFIFPGFTTAPSPITGSIPVTQGGNSNIVINTNNNQTVGGLVISGDFDGLQATNPFANFNFNNSAILSVQKMDITGSATLNFTGNFDVGVPSGGGTLTIGSSSPVIDPSQTSGPGVLNFTNSKVLFYGSAVNIGSGSGANGVLSQNNTEVDMVFGSVTTVGLSSGTGTYTMSNGSSLFVLDSKVVVGAVGGSGTMSISGNSTVSVEGAGILAVESGTLTQGGGSSVTLRDSARLRIGESSGSNAIYNFTDGTLNVNDTSIVVIGDQSGATGVLNQTGGTLTEGATGTFTVGNNGTGSYNLSGGTATFSGSLTVGGGTGLGTLTQSGASSLTAVNQAQIGVAGAGIYNLQGGTADFQGGFDVGISGSFNQTGGTVTTEGASTIEGTFTMSSGTAAFNNSLAVNGDVELNGGVLQIAEDKITGTGSLNLGGGTLKIIDGTDTSFLYSLNGNLTGNSSVFDTTAAPNLTAVGFDNTFGGTGGITLNGNTAFYFLGTNTYTGTTTVERGILVTSENGIGVSNAWNIESSGTIALLLNSSFGYGGNVSGSGALDVIYTAPGETLVMTHADNFSGSITLDPSGAQSGVLQIYNGTFSSISDGGIGSSVTIGGTPATSVAIGTTPTSGTVILSGSNTYTGTTTINSNFTVMARTFTGDVSNSGILSTLGTQTAPGTMTLVGNLTSTGTLHVFVNGATSDVYQIGGASSASPTTLSGVVDIHGTGTGTYVIVTTGTETNSLALGGNGQLNNSGGLAANGATALFSATLIENADNNTLSIATSQKSLALFATNPTQLAVANALDPLTQSPPPEFVPLLSIFNSLDAQGVAQLEEDLAPTQLQVVRNIAFENSTFLVQRIDGTLSDIRNGYTGLDLNGVGYVMPGFSNGLARSMNSMLASNAPSFHTAAPNGVNYYSDGSSSSSAPSSDYSEPTSPSRMTPSQAASPTSYDGQVLSDSPIPMRTSAPPTLRSSRFVEFVSGDAILADINQNATMSDKASYTAGDVTVGAGFRVTSNLTVGVLFDYNHTNADTSSNGSKTIANSYQPGIFATYYNHDFYMNGLFAYGFNQYNYTQVIPLVGTTHGNPNGQQFTANLDGGYDFHPAKDWVLGPTAGITYTHLDVDSFSESGAPLANLNVQSQSVDSLRSRLGARLGYAANLGSVVIQPSVSAMWQHEFLDDGPGITSNFQSYSTAGAFTIPVASPSKDSALLNIGATATLNNSLCFYLNYSADVSQDYLAQSIMGGIKASF